MVVAGEFFSLLLVFVLYIQLFYPCAMCSIIVCLNVIYTSGP